MPFPVGAALGAGASVVGSVFSAVGQSRANRENRREAQRNRQFQERMSSTAHQRETRDLEAAGLNRILGMAGKGSSTPGGNMAVMKNPVPEKAGLSAVTSAMQAATTENIQANTELTNAKTKALAPAAGIGETGGSIIDWIKKNITGADYGAMTDQAKRDATSAREIMNIEVRGSQKETPWATIAQATEAYAEDYERRTGKKPTRAQLMEFGTEYAKIKRAETRKR